MHGIIPTVKRLPMAVSRQDSVMTSQPFMNRMKGETDA
jgi:hypothetical protein